MTKTPSSASRRRFLFGASAVVLAAAAGARWLQDPRSSYISNVLKSRLPYANYDSATENEFISEFLEFDQGMSEVAGHAVAYLGERFAAPLAGLLSAKHAGRIRNKEEAIATMFLLSTDFFDDDDIDKPLTYYGLSDPYVAGCANPFAQLT